MTASAVYGSSGCRQSCLVACLCCVLSISLACQPRAQGTLFVRFDLVFLACLVLFFGLSFSVCVHLHQVVERGREVSALMFPISQSSCLFTPLKCRLAAWSALALPMMCLRSCVFSASEQRLSRAGARALERGEDACR